MRIYRKAVKPPEQMAACPRCNGAGKRLNGKWVHANRTALGVGLRELAERLGVHFTNLADMEAGRRPFPLKLEREVIDILEHMEPAPPRPPRSAPIPRPPRAHAPRRKRA